MKLTDYIGMIGITFVTCIIVVSAILFVDYMDNRNKVSSTNYQKRMDLIGSKIVIGKDTVMIINYDAEEETFDLSNRLEINARVVENK